MLLGVDVGGTFTDAVLVDGGHVLTAKVPSTPHDQSVGALAAVRLVLELAGRAESDVRSFARPSDWLCTHVMGIGYSSQTNTKPEQGLPRPD